MWKRQSRCREMSDMTKRNIGKIVAGICAAGAIAFIVLSKDETQKTGVVWRFRVLPSRFAKCSWRFA